MALKPGDGWRTVARGRMDHRSHEVVNNEVLNEKFGKPLPS